MALQTWKQLGAAADIEDCRMESVLTMGRLCRRLNPKFESRITTEEDRSSETACCQYASPVSVEEFLPRKTIQPCHVMKKQNSKEGITMKNTMIIINFILKKCRTLALLCAVMMLICTGLAGCGAGIKPLSEYWTANSAAAESLRSYVANVTNEKDAENFIPVKDRIAVFDMDGTLTCETFYTYYDTMMFINFCLTDHPERVSEELKAAAAEIRPGYTAGEELARNFAKAYQGMTIQELYDYAVEFGRKETDSFQNMKYRDGFYLPMVEVVKYLYDNDFTIYVVSGTERTTSRAIVANSPISEYVSPAHVIGTEFEVKQKGYEDVPSNMDYKYADGDELVFTGGFVQKNLNANKPIFIEREIGVRPVLAFGNSGSDTSMMNYVLDKRNPYPAQAYMVVADDNVREWGTQDWSEKSSEYKEQGYVPISMKNDFLKIYPDNITRSDTQFVELEAKEAA